MTQNAMSQVFEKRSASFHLAEPLPQQSLRARRASPYGLHPQHAGAT